MPHTAGKRLVEAIRKQLERIDYFCSAENISPNVAVHELRKTFKRLRALLRFYVDFPVEFPVSFSTQIKFFGRSLTQMRESHVNILIFDRISGNNKLIPDRKVKLVREKLADKNRDLIEKGFLAAESYLPFVNFSKALEEQMETMGVDIPAQIQFASQLINSYEQSYNLFQYVSVQSDPEMLHELRKKMKQLYYQFDFIRYQHPRFFRPKTFQLNTITEQLGEDHDLFVFLNDLSDFKTEFSYEELEIMENQVQHLREINRIKLFPKLKHFFTDTPEVFMQKAETIFKTLTITKKAL